jgi:hypothetical protein
MQLNPIFTKLPIPFLPVWPAVCINDYWLACALFSEWVRFCNFSAMARRWHRHRPPPPSMVRTTGPVGCRALAHCTLRWKRSQGTLPRVKLITVELLPASDAAIGAANPEPICLPLLGLWIAYYCICQTDPLGAGYKNNKIILFPARVPLRPLQISAQLSRWSYTVQKFKVICF